MRSALLAAVAAGLLVAPLHGEPRQHPQRPGHDTQQAEDNQGRPQAPVLVKLLNTGRSDAEADQEQREVGNRERAERWTIRLTWALAIIGVLQVAALLMQWWAFKKTLAQMKAAEVRQFRAWVLPGAITLSRSYSQVPSQCVMQVRNSGPSPAFHLTAVAGLVVDDVPPKQLPPPQAPDPLSGEMTLAPDGIVELRELSSGPLTPEQRQAIDAGKQAIYMHGRITYVDAFAKGRVTNFRLFYHGGIDPAGAGKMLFYPEGNDAT